MAFGSIRMEPVFMVLGQSAATAASMAIDAKIPIQDVNYPELKSKLETDDQILNYGQTTLDGIIVDDTEAKLKGSWKQSVFQRGYRLGYKHDGDARDGKASAEFITELPEPGEYAVQIAWQPNPNRSTKVSVSISHSKGTVTMQINQQAVPSGENGFHQLGTYDFHRAASVTVSNESANGYVIIDAVRWVKRGQ